MKNAFTDNDIIRFLYDEMGAAESESLLAALVQDEDLWERYEALQEGMGHLEKVALEPSEASLEVIRDFVKTSGEDARAAKRTTLEFAGKYLHAGAVSINLHAVVGAALSVFLVLSIAGSAYKLTRQKFDNPNTGTWSQQQEPAPVHDPRFEWDTNEIDRELDRVKDGVKSLQDEPRI